MIPIQDKVRAALLAHEEIERETTVHLADQAGGPVESAAMGESAKRFFDAYLRAIEATEADKTLEHRAVLAMQGKTHDRKSD